MANVVTGVVHGTTIELDAPIPTLDGQRVRVVVEPSNDDAELTAAEHAELLRVWAARGPQGPIDDDSDFPDDA